MTAYVTDENGSICCKFENLVRYLCSTTIFTLLSPILVCPPQIPPSPSKIDALHRGPAQFPGENSECILFSCTFLTQPWVSLLRQETVTAVIPSIPLTCQCSCHPLLHFPVSIKPWLWVCQHPDIFCAPMVSPLLGSLTQQTLESCEKCKEGVGREENAQQ